jgi:hypothetical protein
LAVAELRRYSGEVEKNDVTRVLTRRTIVASLKEFLESEAEKLRSEQSEALTKREEWIAAVDRLLAQIKAWLAQADTKGILMIDGSPIRIGERGLGTYEIPALTIGMGTREVRIKPIARVVAAPLRETGRMPVPRAYGRVDMTNGLDRYMIFRTWKDPDDRWTIIEENGPLMEPFDQGSFESAFQSLLE